MVEELIKRESYDITFFMSPTPTAEEQVLVNHLADLYVNDVQLEVLLESVSSDDPVEANVAIKAVDYFAGKGEKILETEVEMFGHKVSVGKAYLMMNQEQVNHWVVQELAARYMQGGDAGVPA